MHQDFLCAGALFVLFATKRIKTSTYKIVRPHQHHTFFQNIVSHTLQICPPQPWGRCVIALIMHQQAPIYPSHEQVHVCTTICCSCPLRCLSLTHTMRGTSWCVQVHLVNPASLCTAKSVHAQSTWETVALKESIIKTHRAHMVAWLSGFDPPGCSIIILTFQFKHHGFGSI